MDEIRRVMKKTASCWINLGDTYGPDKSLTCVPDEFKVNCRRNGWIVRNHIPWVKDNPMPQSPKDRFTNFWEPIFFFVKQPKYYFNLDAVRIPLITKIKAKKIRKDDGIQSTLIKVKKIKSKKKQDLTLGKNGKPLQTYKGFNERWEEQILTKKYGIDKEQRARVSGYMHSVTGGNSNGKNPGDVFRINPRPFPDAHFATFPLELPEKILKCACPPKGIVLDPFFGSGTVGYAAEMLDRQWIGIEKKQEYIDIARKRLNPKLLDKLT